MKLPVIKKLYIKRTELIMIIDSLNNLSKYASTHPRFPRAFAFLQELLNNNAPDGRHVLEGTEIPEEIFVNIMSPENPLKPAARAEVHKKYIDVQILLKGDERMSVPTTTPEVEIPYNEAKDCTMYVGVPFDQCHNLYATEGSFAIFFAGELHAPSIACGDQPSTVRKAVIKVLAD